MTIDSKTQFKNDDTIMRVDIVEDLPFQFDDEHAIL